MRIFEAILILALGLGLLRLSVGSIRRLLPTPWYELATIVLFGLQIVIDKYRWQMLPAYILLTIVLFSGWRLFRREAHPDRPKWIVVLAATFFGLFYLITTLLPILLPIPRLTPPDGPYAVGTRSWQWTDPTRLDPYAPRGNAARQLVAQAWYPVDPGIEGEESPWMPAAKIIAPAVADWIDLPSFFLNHLVLVKTQALQDANVAMSEEGFPLLLFSHGYGGFRAQNTNQMQYLASHGYIVVAVEHTYGAVVTVFPDGQIAYHNPDTMPDDVPPAEDLEATRALGSQWSGDLSFVLDQLSSLGQTVSEEAWEGKLDLNRVGAFGHSTGGGAVIEFCSRDPRCRAVLTLDPFIKPVSERALKQGLALPALHMFSEAWTSIDNLERFAPLVEHSTPRPLVMSVLGSAHYDFSDLPLLTPLAHQLGLKGPINGKRMTSIVNTYLLAFFDQTLRKEASSLLDGPTPEFPEVIYQIPDASR
jgi:dienelactone hydrolase